MRKLGADIDKPDDELVTPLSAAAAAGHLDAVQELLMYGANVNAADRMGITPFFTACAQGHTQVVEAMQEFFEGTCDVNKVTLPRRPHALSLSWCLRSSLLTLHFAHAHA